MSRSLVLLVLLALSAALIGARCAPSAPAPPPSLAAGFRWSPYGPPPGEDPGPAYWADLATQMSDRFEGAVPEGIWVVCEVLFDTGGCLLDFDGTAEDPLIEFSGNPADPDQAALSLFDSMGVRVWLQVEPGFASVPELIEILLARYGHHPSVIGFGVDVEWYLNAAEPVLGSPVSDQLAMDWVNHVRQHAPRYRLFLKHWLPEYMPPSLRRWIVFVNDSQGHASLDAMVSEFALWGQHFRPAPVAFQYGYPADQSWWSELADPAGEIGQRLVDEISNAGAIYWVDFTALEVFP